MKTLESLFAAMKAVAKQLDLPKHYKSDLDFDRKTLLAQPLEATKYIWILREHGTNMVPLWDDMKQLWATEYTTGACSSNTTRFFLIDTARHCVEPISAEKVELLIHQMQEPVLAQPA